MPRTRPLRRGSIQAHGNAGGGHVALGLANAERAVVEDRGRQHGAGVALPHALDNATGAIIVSDPPFTGASLSSVLIGGTNELEFDSLGRPFDAGSAALTSDGQIQLSNGISIKVNAVTGLAEVSG